MLKRLETKTMTKKDYVILAAALKSASRYPDNSDHLDGVADACDAIADALGRENPRFNRIRFMNAALPEGR